MPRYFVFREATATESTGRKNIVSNDLGWADLGPTRSEFVQTVERAAQIWPVLAWAARNRQVLTYDLLGRLVGVPRPALGRFLEPIQSYCLINALPPLTILVVSQQTGLQGAGFVAAADIPSKQVEVFAHDWLQRGCPTPDEFRGAVTKLPSNGASFDASDSTVRK